jgi:hypothetical protein
MSVTLSGAGSADNATDVEKCLMETLRAVRIPDPQVQRREMAISFGKWGSSAEHKAGKVAAAGSSTYW